MDERRIETVADMLDLSPEEFQRMLPDLVLWYSFAKPLHGTVEGVANTGFLWTDDGVNEVTAAHLTDPSTGQVMEVRLG